MCLEILTDTFDPPLEEEGIGYKVMFHRKVDEKWVFLSVLYHHMSQYQDYPCKTANEKRTMEQGIWQKSFSENKHETARWDSALDRNYVEYEPAFHIFTSWEAADAYRTGAGFVGDALEPIVRVRYRKVVAKGSENEFEVVVAREMFIEGVAEEEEAA